MSETLTLSSLPLFPLGTVLFPDGVLPLRIFEVRYLDMIGKCHKAGAPFGVVTLAQGAEVRRPGGGAEVFYSVGTLATITALQTPQPGQMTIRCHGEQRFRISRSMQLKHGLWIADVGRLEDDLTVPIPDDLKATTLDRKNRLALKVTIDNELETDRTINELMGKDVGARFKFIMENSADVKELDV